MSVLQANGPPQTEPGDAALQPWMLRLRASVGRVVTLWAVAMLLLVLNTVLFSGDDGPLASSTLFLAGAPIFAGFVAGWVLGLGRSTLYLLRPLASWGVVAGAVAIMLKLVLPPAMGPSLDAAAGAIYALATTLLVYFCCSASRGRGRRLAAAALALGVNLGAAGLSRLDNSFWRLSEAVQPLLGRPSRLAEAPPPRIDDDVLWGAQPGLLAKQAAAVPAPVAGHANVYLMAVAASGGQALFSREAHEALRTAALHFGGEARGAALLSNGQADLLKTPLATRGAIAAVAGSIGAKADHDRDVLFIYLVSHGGPEAELSSDLPDYRAVQPISAASTAAALRAGGVKRRVIVVSACYAGSWIPALADDDTIVIAAAARDRTSFGCDDSRRFTVFGEAFLGSLASPTLSLHDAFEDARRKISAEEQKDKVTPSMPQASVGRNMRDVWMGRP